MKNTTVVLIIMIGAMIGWCVGGLIEKSVRANEYKQKDQQERLERLEKIQDLLVKIKQLDEEISKSKREIETEEMMKKNLTN